MQETASTNLVAWLDNPATKALLVCLRRRQAPTVVKFLAGNPVDPVEQGRAAALHEIEQLLSLPASEVERIFREALRERK